MQIEDNKLKIIKKSRSKIKKGDYFCFNINNSFYVGVVIHNQLIEKYGDNTMFSALITNYNENSIKDITSDKLIIALNNRDLLMPPINLNKMGWTKGYFINIGNINLSNIEKDVIEDCRFFSGLSSIYDIEYKKMKIISDFCLVGNIGGYNHLGLESMVQISLDLEFTEVNPEGYNPYEYYDELKTIYPNLELPFWYYKAKERLKT